MELILLWREYTEIYRVYKKKKLFKNTVCQMVTSLKEKITQEGGFKEWSWKVSCKKITLGLTQEGSDRKSPVNIWGQTKGAA